MMYKKLVFVIFMVLSCLMSSLAVLPASRAENPKGDELVSLPPSKKFHKSTCLCLFNRPFDPGALVKYKTAADAKKAGMTSCKICNPS